MTFPHENFGLCMNCYDVCELASILIDGGEPFEFEGLCKDCEKFYQEYLGWPDSSNEEEEQEGK